MATTGASLGPTGMVVGETFVVPDSWIDHNRHVNLARYADAFYLGARQMSDYLGMTREFKERTATASFAAELCIGYRREVTAGTRIRVESRILGFDEKRIHSWHELVVDGQSGASATGEMLALNIDRNLRRVAPMPDELLERLRALVDVQSKKPSPEGLRLALA